MSIPCREIFQIQPMFTVGSVFPAAVRAGKPDRLGRFAAAVQGAVIAECRAAKAAHDVHEIGHIVVHKNDVIHLLAQIQCQQVYDIIFAHDNVANFMHIVGGVCGTAFGYVYAMLPRKRRRPAARKKR